MPSVRFLRGGRSTPAELCDLGARRSSTKFGHSPRSVCTRVPQPMPLAGEHRDRRGRQSDAGMSLGSTKSRSHGNDARVTPAWACRILRADDGATRQVAAGSSRANAWRGRSAVSKARWPTPCGRCLRDGRAAAHGVNLAIDIHDGPR